MSNVATVGRGVRKDDHGSGIGSFRLGWKGADHPDRRKFKGQQAEIELLDAQLAGLQEAQEAGKSDAMALDENNFKETVARAYLAMERFVVPSRRGHRHAAGEHRHWQGAFRPYQTRRTASKRRRRQPSPPKLMAHPPPEKWTPANNLSEIVAIREAL